MELKKGEVFVRLKPYDPSRGHMRERFRMGEACGWGDLMFTAGKLMILDVEAAEWLRANVRQIEGRESSPRAFDVWYSAQEAVAALRAEKARQAGAVQSVRSLRPQQPPPLKSAELSNLDEPKVVDGVEVELKRQAEQEDLVQRSEIRDGEGDYGDLSPSDLDLLTAAADEPPPVPEDKPKTRRKPVRRKK